MDYEKYLINKGKEDLISSLKALDKKVLKERMKKEQVNDIRELKEVIIDTFELCLAFSKDDKLTENFFRRLIDNENSNILSFYQQDMKSGLVFVYKNGDNISYYIPTELKKIIKKVFNWK